MRAHDSDDDGDGGTSPGHGGLRGPSPGASPAMSPALQGLSGLAESFSPEQIPVDEDEQARNRLAKASRYRVLKHCPPNARVPPFFQMMLAIALSLNASQTPTQTPTLSPAQPPHGTLSPGAAVAGMEPAAAPVSAPASVDPLPPLSLPPSAMDEAAGVDVVGVTPSPALTDADDATHDERPPAAIDVLDTSPPPLPVPPPSSDNAAPAVAPPPVPPDGGGAVASEADLAVSATDLAASEADLAVSATDLAVSATDLAVSATDLAVDELGVGVALGSGPSAAPSPASGD